MEFIVQCRGCGETSIRRENWWRDLVPDPELAGSRMIDVDFSPYRTWRRRPDWLEQIEQSAPDLHGLLEEIYTATNDEQVRILALGVRAAVDVLMVQFVGDIGGFEQKLKKMVETGHLTKAQSETLDIVIDAGSAVAHRGFRPSRELLVEMVVTMETIIRELYISGPMMKALKLRIPPRPPRGA
jgi:hypothetical protein